MAFLQPPITGDLQLDSWTLRLTQQINQGLVPGASGTGGGGGGGSTPGPRGLPGEAGNSAIYLYQRTADNTAPTAFPATVAYNFENVNAVVITTNSNPEWHEDPGDTGTEPYLWVTFRYVAGASGSVTEGWDTPTLLGVPGDDAISIDVRTDSGVVFRNPGSSTSNIVLTAYVSIGGEVQSDTIHNNYTYNWLYNNNTIYVTEPTVGALTGPWTVVSDSSGNPETTNPGGNSVPADSSMTRSDQLRSITVPDTAVLGMALISCDVSNIT